MLPWFIWEEVIDYVIQVDRQYCLVNKEWFQYSAGRVMTLSTDMISGGKRPSSWLKLAETLKLRYFSCMDLDYLLECHKFKHISLDFRKSWQINHEQLKKNISHSNLQSLVLKFDHSDEKEYSILFLKEVSPKLESLDIDCYSLSYNELSSIFYPKLTKFKICAFDNEICVGSIDQSMPNLKYLSIFSFINFNNIPTSKTIFKNLVSLSLGLNHFRYDDFKTIEDLFSFSFPSLLSCYLDNSLKIYSPEKIPQSMPNLKRLQFCLVGRNETIYYFPDKKMSQLEELKVTFEEEIIELSEDDERYFFESNSDPVFLSLSDLPRLKNVIVSGQVKFINHNGDSNSLPRIFQIIDDFMKKKNVW